MNILWDLHLDKDIDYYFNLPSDTILYIRDLKHEAPSFIKRVKQEGIIIYGQQGNTCKDKKWLKASAYGRITPEVKWIKLSTGVKIYEYGKFDIDSDNATYEEMGIIIKELEQFGYPDSPTRLIEQELPEQMAKIPNSTQFLKGIHHYLCAAFKGGANCILRKKEKFDNEVHLDYHQIYGYAMAHNDFPWGNPILKEGYHQGNFY